MTKKVYVTTEELIDNMNRNGSLDMINHMLLNAASRNETVNIYAVPRGGIPASYLYAKYFKSVNYKFVDKMDETVDIIIDDLIDSGNTIELIKNMYPDNNLEVAVLINKQTDVKYKNKWIIFPWEKGIGCEESSADDIVIRMLEYIGENPSREGLLETPKRVLKAWDEWFEGYKYSDSDIKKMLKVFEDGAEGVRNELVIVADIPFTSFCEHHIAMFEGVVSIGYISNGKILGLSKFARLTKVFASRLQVQERLTSQIAQALVENLSEDVMVVCDKTTHSCMCSRGARTYGTNTITSSIHGRFKDNMALRAEFLSLIGRK